MYYKERENIITNANQSNLTITVCGLQHLDKLHHKINCNLWHTLSYEHYFADVIGELVLRCVGERINLNDTSCPHYCIILQFDIRKPFKLYLLYLFYTPLWLRATRIFLLFKKKLKIRFCIECDWIVFEIAPIHCIHHSILIHQQWRKLEESIKHFCMTHLVYHLALQM